jgi:hypothetical protein
MPLRQKPVRVFSVVCPPPRVRFFSKERETTIELEDKKKIRLRAKNGAINVDHAAATSRGSGCAGLGRMEGEIVEKKKPVELQVCAAVEAAREGW